MSLGGIWTVGRPGDTQHVREGIICFVARVLVDDVVVVSCERKRDRPGLRPGQWVLDVHLVLERVGVAQSESLNES